MNPIALLWLNTLAASAATTIYVIGALIWMRRGNPAIATLFAAAALGAVMVALGMIRVLNADDPTISATLARQWVWLAVGAPAIANLLGLINDRMRAAFADHTLMRAETRQQQRRDCDERRAPSGSDRRA